MTADYAWIANRIMWKTIQEGDYFAIEESDGLLDIPERLRGRSPFGSGWPEDEGRIKLAIAVRESRVALHDRRPDSLRKAA